MRLVVVDALLPNSVVIILTRRLSELNSYKIAAKTRIELNLGGYFYYISENLLRKVVNTA